MAYRPGDRTDVNRSAILAHLGAHGPTSRAELARLLAVSPALMSQLTKDLLSDGLLVELDHSPSQGGRPARLLGLVATAGRAIGVKVVADHVAFVEMQLDGTLSRSASVAFDASEATQLTRLADLIAGFIAAGDDVSLLGVGVGVPGAVDRQGDGIVDSPQLGWHRVSVGPTLRQALGLPVLVENDVNALAVAERLYGLGREHANFLVLTIGTGVGAGLVIDGVVVRGFSGSAGEVGHIPVADGGPLCGCGNHGCLEAFVGENALLRTARERGVVGPTAAIADLWAAADAGTPGATAIFAECGRILGRTLAGIANTVDPGIVIVLGEGTPAWKHWSVGFEPALRASLIAPRRGLAVAVETWQDESWAQGAAALVLSTPFDADGVTGDQGRLVRARLVEQSAPSMDDRVASVQS